MTAQGVLLVVSGPSGAGKGTICQRLLEMRRGLAYSVSCTTRMPRQGEVDGENYFFLTKEKFTAMIQGDELLEYADVYGNFYGTPKAYVLSRLAAGHDVLLEIDVQGALKVKEHFPDGVFVFIVPPSLEELSKRIHKRGTDPENVIAKRLLAAGNELAYASKYDYIVINDEVEKATKQVNTIMDAEHLSVKRMSLIAQQICHSAKI